MKKKLFAIVMSATMVMSFMPSLAFAYVEAPAEPTYNDDWSYVLGADGKVAVNITNYDETHFQSTCTNDLLKVHLQKGDDKKYDKSTAVVLEAATHHASKYELSGSKFVVKKGRTEADKDCLKGTWTNVYCVDCNKVVVEEQNFKPAAADAKHSFSERPEKVSDATCTTNQINGYYCTKCGALEKTWEVPGTAKNHDFELPVAKEGKYNLAELEGKEGYVPATCIADATYTAKCKNGCGEEKTIVVSTERPAHVYNHPFVTEATCTEPEMTTMYCTTKGCDAHKAAYETGKAKGHNLVDDPANSKAPTCTEAGVAAKKCNRTGCTYTETKEVPATGHKFGKVRTQVSPATCTEDEVLAYKCQNANCNEYSDPVAGQKALGHNAAKDVEWEFVNPTCTDKAYKVKYCGRIVAGKKCKEVVEVAELDLVKDAVLIGDKKVEAKGHVMQLKSVVDATCSKEGVKTYECEACGETQTETIAKLPHTEVVETVDATCTKAGVKTTKCSVCDEVIDTVEIPALGHDFVKTDDVVEPTCTEAGHQGYKCSACGETKVEELAALGHTVVEDAAVAATATKTGLTAGSHCSVCNEVIEAQTVTVAKAKTPSVKAGKKSLTATAAKVTGATKYQVAYKRSGSKYTWKYATASAKNAQTIKNLVKGKKYYVKVRTISGDVVGAWSSTKAVKVK